MKLLSARTVFILSAAFLFFGLVFSLGMLSVRKGWMPWEKASDIRLMITSVVETGKILPTGSYFRRSPDTPDQPHVVFDQDAVAPGFLAVTRLNADIGRYVIDLMDTNGTIIHTWPINYADLVEGGDPTEFTHASKVLADGSAMVNFDDGRAIARLDSCGGTIWVRSDQTYHHVIEPDVEGFWTWRAFADTRGHDQKLFRFDVETGEELETIDLLDIIQSAPENALVTSIPKGYEFVREYWNWGMEDIFHPNDIEPLPAELADAFPQFSAGDLLISLRNIDLVAVLDRETHEILWSMRGPWRQQHDPDWQADGTITVFNNNTRRWRSNIVRIDPKTNQSRVIFQDPDASIFYSSIMGEHQRLPNGNWLILSTTQGRVIEVTQTGKPVREYNNIVNAKSNAIITFAEHLPVDFFSTSPKCASK